MLKSEQIQAEIDNKQANVDAEALKGTEAKHEQIIQWRNEISVLQMQQGDAKVEEANQQNLQERLQLQEEEIEKIKLPYDFDELLSEEGHPITGANDMIIEVVKDTERQANIKKNQALDEQKAAYEAKIKLHVDQHDSLFSDFTTLQDSYRALENQFQIKSDALEKANSDKAQAILDRDDAYSKRDAAFRQLQEANETIASQKIKLENAPQAKSSLDISPSDKLAKMVKESLEAKVNRGLSRWPDVIPVMEPQPEHVEELVADAEPQPIEEGNKVDAAAPGLADSQPTEVGQTQTAESEVITLESLHARLKIVEQKLSPVENAIQAVA